MKTAVKNTPSVQMINLGCAKNVVDAEEMLGVLAQDGFAIDAGNDRADVVVINTCGFIDSAKQESIDVILNAIERKKRGDIKRVIVTGCLSQRYGADLAKELPGVDLFVGTGEIGRIAERTRQTLVSREMLIDVAAKPHHHWLDSPARLLSTAPWTAYLKISEGCDHRCTFCAIPSFRGNHVSKPLDRVVLEAAMLVERGVREINLIAQDSTQYGFDLAGRCLLPDLLEALSTIDELKWIRVFYCYPSRITSEIVRAISRTPKVCQYIDMPLQHADDQVLLNMKRPTNGGRYLDILQEFRQASPDVAIRTTFIVGFPGETEAQFETLLTFVEAAQFDRVGVFEYSVEDGTPSANLPNRIPSRIKRERKDQLMRLQRRISEAKNQSWIGRDLEVLVEQIGIGKSFGGVSAHSESGQSASSRSAPSGFRSSAMGRSFRDAPEIDGQVYVTGRKHNAGEFVKCKVVGATSYDLLAEPLFVQSDSKRSVELIA